MPITADQLRAGMHLAFESVYVRVENVAQDTHGMLTAMVRDARGELAPVRFHGAECLTVGA
ncbi:hypothetical protein ACU4IU_00240 [Brevibacterium sp. CSND-B09]|uniref:hypothetical protein n=1 Tax=Brevibacterium sp. CSND-B09 TaxID=3462571 RepID=UPI00406A68D2